ncbi:MAG: hypothetical protein GWM98_13930 [Nitrospinaceae bacterium]|nr:hypothetical protein [Nitrospinaceae bacterium]
MASSVAALYGLIQVALKGVSLHHRISGTFSHYMTYAGILMQTALGAAAYLLFRNSKNRWVWAAFLLIITALALTLTRQAWLGFGVGFLILLTIRKPVLAAGFPILVALVFWLSPPAVKERVASLSNLGDATFKERIIMWQVGWEMFQDYPVTGCGFHCLRIVGKDYPGYHELAVPYHTLHNNIVQIAIDAGTLGVLAWLYLWLSYFVAAGRKTASKTGSAPRWPILASIGAITAFMVGGLFETNFYDSEVVMLAYVFMALPFVETPKETGKQN